MRIYYQLRGAHYHCRVFFGHGKSGDLCVALDEWPEFQSSFSKNVRWVNEEDFSHD